MKIASTLAALVCVGMISVVACSEDPTSSRRSDPGAGGGNGALDAGSGGKASNTGGSGGSSSGGSSSDGVGGRLVLDGGKGKRDNQTIDGANACNSGTATGQLKPAAIQFVIDMSGSMRWLPTENVDAPPGESKWDLTRVALLEAIDALPDTASVGINYFSGCEEACDSLTVAVNLAPLGTGAQREAIASSLSEVSPSGGTPTHGGYKLGIETVLEAPPNTDRFVVLITDGTPTQNLECTYTDCTVGVETQPIIDEAEAARTRGVRTFVIGSPGSEGARSALSQIASQGGTAKSSCNANSAPFCHFDMTQEPNFGQALKKTLLDIAGQVIPCELELPSPPARQVINQKSITVQVVDTETQQATTLPRNDDAACDEGYSLSDDGKKVVLCKQTCQDLSREKNQTVKFSFACDAVVY